MIALTKGKYLGSVRYSAPANGLLISTTDYFENNKVSPMHYHENAHLSFVLRGTMCVKRKKTDTAIESFSYLRSGEEHQNSLHSDHCKNINLELEQDFFTRYGINEAEFNPQETMNQPSSTLLMVRLYKELLFRDDSFADSVHMLLLQTASSWKTLRSHTPPWVKNVRELLHDQWNELISLQQISKIVNIHPVTISKYFPRYFGMSFGEYRRSLKIERAISLIASSDQSLTEISHACGFFDQSHFIKAFREATSLLPTQYRNF